MKKIFLLALLSLILGLGLASAEYVELPKGTCTWTRTGWDNEISSRPTREFQGVWGRLSDGSIICFSPGRARTKKTDPTITETTTTECHEETNTICEDKEVCEENCEDEWVCKKWCGFGCWKWCCDWEKEETCSEECHTEKECHEETNTVCS